MTVDLDKCDLDVARVAWVDSLGEDSILDFEWCMDTIRHPSHPRDLDPEHTFTGGIYAAVLAARGGNP